MSGTDDGRVGGGSEGDTDRDAAGEAGDVDARDLDTDDLDARDLDTDDPGTRGLDAGEVTGAGAEGEVDADGTTLALGVASAVLFAAGLLVTESVGEVAVDVDLKPFFLPYLLIALSRYGLPALSVGLGAAIGEGVLDVFEGYELDDPVGFLGYVFGFLVFGWYLHEVAEDPESTRSMAVGAALGAFVQATFEGVAFLIFDAGAGPTAAGLSILGNTVTHGVLLGAIPLVLLYLLLRDRVGRVAV